MSTKPSTAVPDAICDLLRDATGPQHARLHRHPVLAGILAPGYRLARYVALLRAYAAMYPALEDWIATGLAQQCLTFDYDRRRKSQWLLADLACFGEGPARQMNLPRDMPTPSPASLVGVLYVVEGATLGGRLIAERLARHLDLDDSTGARFFCGYGAATASRWREFVGFANASLLDLTQYPGAVAAAAQTFGLYATSLDRHARAS